MGSFWGPQRRSRHVSGTGHPAPLHVTPITPSDILLPASSPISAYDTYCLIEFLCARSISCDPFRRLVSAFLLITIVRCLRVYGSRVAHSHRTPMRRRRSLPAHLAPSDLPSGATVPLSSLPQVVKHVGLFLPPFTSSCLQSAIYWAFAPWSPVFARTRLARRVGRPHILFVCPSSSAGSLSPRFPAAPSARRRHRNPFLLLGLGKQYQPTYRWRKRCMIAQCSREAGRFLRKNAVTRILFLFPLLAQSTLASRRRAPNWFRKLCFHHA